MSQTTRLGLSVLAGALVLGILADLLNLRSDPWGINAPIFFVLLAAGAFSLARTRQVPIAPPVRWLPIAACLFAAGLAWRDSGKLTFLNILAVLMLFAVASYRRIEGRLPIAAVTEYLIGMVRVVFGVAFGALPLAFSDIRRQEIETSAWQQRTLIGLRGVLIAVPLIAVFGGLFASADPVFDHYLSKLFDWDFADIAQNIGWTLLWAWLSAGLLWAFLMKQWYGPPKDDATPARRMPSLSLAEIGIPLGLLNVLFLAFVIVQFRFFFGGAQYVRETIGMTYTAYARGGFFELVWVSFLVLPVLLVVHALLPKDAPKGQRAFGWLAGALIALLFVIMASAIQRMRLYVQSDGLTELRLYTSAFMAWLAIVFVWFLATVLRGRRDRFAFGALIAGFIVLAVLDCMNPDNLIVRTNLSRPSARLAFDTAYNTSLSADSVPALVAGIPRLSPQKQQLAAYYILQSWRPPKHRDWRAWNYGRSRAWRAVSRDLPHLQAIAKAPPPTQNNDD